MIARPSDVLLSWRLFPIEKQLNAFGLSPAITSSRLIASESPAPLS
jgi:hypothetical protein